MKYIKEKLNNIDIFLIPLKKYKYTLGRIMYVMPFSPEAKTYNLFLKEILTRGTESYPTKKDMAKILDDLYSVKTYVSTSQSGNTLSFSFFINFINDKYTEPNMLGKYLELVNEQINHPLVKDGGFDEKKVEEARRYLKDMLDNMKANPNYMADEIFSDIFMPDTPYSVHEFGLESLIDTVTGKELYEYYQRMLKESYVTIYACGDIDKEEWMTNIKDKLRLDGIKRGNFKYHFPQVKNKDVKDLTQDFNTKQSIFYMGFKLEDINDFENLYVKKVLNYVFGSGPASKLFTTVREKNSLCYSIYSTMSPTYDVMVINSSINAENKDKVVKLINKELENMRKGKFTLKEVQNGKHFYINALLSNEDSLSSVIDAVISKEIIGIDLPKDRVRMVKKITKKDVVNLANKIYPDTIFLLKGVEDNG